jgi:putative membrane protein
VFWSALGGLVTLGAGLATTRLIEDLYARAQWLGTVGAVLAAVALLALLIICAREIAGLFHLASIEKLHARAAATLVSDDRDEAREIVRALTAKLAATPSLAHARGEIESHLAEIIDGRDLLHIAERQLMAPLDREASQLIARTATRVSVVTAVSPRAAVDIAFVAIAALGMIRRLAAIYGGRPGMLGLIRLVRHIIAHLALTGGIAVGDGLIQQVLGHGIAAKLSARLGEGVLNGLLTARLGLAAIEVARPLPFAALPLPKLADIAGDLLRREAREKPPPGG